MKTDTSLKDFFERSRGIPPLPTPSLSRSFRADVIRTKNSGTGGGGNGAIGMDINLPVTKGLNWSLGPRPRVSPTSEEPSNTGPSDEVKRPGGNLG